MRDLMFRCSQIVRTEIDVLRGQMERNGIELFFGTASFLDPHTVRIQHLGQNIDITADCILIAVGTTPCPPRLRPLHAAAKWWTATGCSSSKRCPGR